MEEKTQNQQEFPVITVPFSALTNPHPIVFKEKNVKFIDKRNNREESDSTYNTQEDSSMKDKEQRGQQYEDTQVEDNQAERNTSDQPFTIYVRGNMATEVYRRARNAAYASFDDDYGMQEVASTRRRNPSYYDQSQNQGRRQDEKGNGKAKKEKSKKGKVVGYEARRPVLFIVALLVIAVLVVNVLAVVKIMPDYTGMFITRSIAENAGTTETDEDGNEITYPTHIARSAVDPVMSLISYIKGDKNATWSEDDMISQSFFTDCFVKIMADSQEATDESASDEAESETKTTAYAEETSTSSGSETETATAEESGDSTTLVRTICYIGMPVVIVLLLVTIVLLVVKMLIALFSGRKVKYGFLFITSILYLVLIAVVTLVWNEQGLQEAKLVFMAPLKAFGMEVNNASFASVGLGFYINVIGLLVAWFISAFAYKKVRQEVSPAPQYRR